MAKVKLTQKYIDNPPPVPTGKAKMEHCDTALPGLLFEQRASNNEWGSYRLRYKNAAGKTSYAPVGKSCEITLAEAREKAKKLKAEIQLGADPQADLREKRKSLTLDTFMTEHYFKHARQHLRRWQYLEGMHRQRISPHFGGVKLNRITKHAAQQFHNDLRNEGLAPATCDHHLKLIRQALNLAVEWGFLDKNPVEKVKLFNVDNQVEHLMSPDELQRLMAALDKRNNAGKPMKKGWMGRQAIHFLLLTGARVNEAMHAKWSEIDLKARTWTIQAVTSKSKKRRSVPLSDAAMALLKELPSKGKSEWLFTSSRGDGTQRLQSVTKVFKSVREEADLKHIRLHDLRHQFASFLVNSGRSLYEVQQILGHSDPSVTQRYAHLSTATLQDAANSAGDYLDRSLAESGD